MAEIEFHYIKVPDYREIPVHGAVGGLMPNGEGIFFALYSERSTLPQVAAYALSNEGQLGEEVPERRVSKDGVTRSLQVGAYLSVTQATALRDYLDRQITEYTTMVARNGQ